MKTAVLTFRILFCAALCTLLGASELFAQASFQFGTGNEVTIHCALQNDTYTFHLLLINNGNAASASNRIVHTNPQHFPKLTASLPGGIVWDPATSSEVLFPGDTASISLQYNIVAGVSTSDTDRVSLVYGSGDTLGPFFEIVHTIGTAAEILQEQWDLGSVSFRAPGPPLTTPFTISNTTIAPVEIDSVTFAPNGPFNSSFRISLPSGATLPYTMPRSGSFTAYVSFDDSVSDAPDQSVNVSFHGSMCDSLSQTIIAHIANSGVLAGSASENFSLVPLNDRRSFQLIVPEGITEPARLELVNLLGEIVYSSQVTESQIVDGSSLPRGIYFWRITSRNQSQTGKIMLGS